MVQNKEARFLWPTVYLHDNNDAWCFVIFEVLKRQLKLAVCEGHFDLIEWGSKQLSSKGSNFPAMCWYSPMSSVFYMRCVCVSFAEGVHVATVSRWLRPVKDVAVRQSVKSCTSVSRPMPRVSLNSRSSASIASTCPSFNLPSMSSMRKLANSCRNPSMSQFVHHTVSFLLMFWLSYSIFYFLFCCDNVFTS